jgi:hypothetical protein
MPRLLLALCSLALGCGGPRHPQCGGDLLFQTYPDAAPPRPGTRYLAAWGPVTLPPGAEATRCVWMRLDNASEAHVVSDSTILGVGAERLTDKDSEHTTEQRTPVPCVAATSDVALVPADEPFTFAPHQMVKLELHYDNNTDDDYAITASIQFLEPAATTP